MAYYRADFESDTLAAEPAGFTKRWNFADTTVAVVENADAPKGKAVRVLRSAANRVLVAHDAASADADRNIIKQRALIRLPANFGDYSTTSPAGHWLVARASGAAASETGYAPGVARPIGNTNALLRWAQYVSGAGTLSNLSPTEAIPVGGLYWMQLLINGSSQTFAIYNYSDFALASPLVTETRTNTAITADGWVGFGGFTQLGGTDGEQWLLYEAATGATELPALVPEGAPTITSVTPGVTTAEIVYSTSAVWSGTSVEYRVNGGSWAALDASPATITGLTAGTAYNSPGLELRAVNSAGGGTASAPTTFTTAAAGTIKLRVDQLLYEDDAETTLFAATGLTFRVLTQDATASLVYQTASGAVTAGALTIVDVAFETLTETYDVVVIGAGLVRGVFPATVVQD